MNQMNKPSTLILTMPALLVRAHKTDTNAWYPVAASQPRASTVQWTAPRQSPSSTAWRRKHRKSRAGMGKCKAGSNGKWKRGMVLLHKRQQQPRRDGVAKPEKGKNEKAAQNNVGRVPFANNSGRHGQGSARIMFLNDARWQKVTSKCKNMKRWTQQTKIKEENAKKAVSSEWQ